MIDVVEAGTAKNNLNSYFNSTLTSSDYKNLKLKGKIGFLVFYSDCLDGIASSAIFNSRGAKIFDCDTSKMVFHGINPEIPIDYNTLTDKVQGKLDAKSIYLIFLDFSISQHRMLSALSVNPFITIDHNSYSINSDSYIQVINENFASCAALMANIFPVAHTDENPENSRKLIDSVNLIESCGISLIGSVPEKDIQDSIYEALMSYPGSFSMYAISKKMKSSQVLKAVYNYLIDEITPENETNSKEMLEFNKKAWTYDPVIEYEYNIANGIKIGAIVYSSDKFDAVYKQIALWKAVSLPYDILLFATEITPKKVYEITVLSKIPCNVGLFCQNNNGTCKTNRIGSFVTGTTSIIKKLNVIVEDLKSYITVG